MEHFSLQSIFNLQFPQGPEMGARVADFGDVQRFFDEIGDVAEKFSLPPLVPDCNQTITAVIRTRRRARFWVDYEPTDIQDPPGLQQALREIEVPEVRHGCVYLMQVMMHGDGPANDRMAFFPPTWKEAQEEVGAGLSDAVLDRVWPDEE